MKSNQSDQVYLSNFQRFSVHDGPGIRTILFFLGCPLRCTWCQNPENLQSRPALMYNRQDCIGCAGCVEKCPENATYVDDRRQIQIDREKCEVCGRCVEVCFPGARSICGTAYTVDQCLTEILKDKVFYDNTGGGVTLSGGEPTMHPEFVTRLLQRCQEEGIHTAIETCGHTRWESLKQIARFTDLFLYDIKAIDPKRHRRWTGVDNHLILSNARRLAEMKKKMIIRVPLIPDVNDDDEEFGRIAGFAQSLKTVQTLHLLPLHHVGKSKYESLGMPYNIENLEESDTQRIDRCRQIAEAHGLRVDVGGSGFPSERLKKAKKQREPFYIYSD